MVLPRVHLRAACRADSFSPGLQRRRVDAVESFVAGRIVVLALAACAQIIVGIEWPGYPEQIAFLLLLIPAFVPMTSAARLGAATLAMSAFDGVVFPLAAMILFCFPQRDRVPGFILIRSYCALFVFSYVFNLAAAFEMHYTIRPRSYSAI